MIAKVYKYLPIFVVILSAFLASKALFHPGLPPTHDGEYHVIRFYEFDKTLRAGSLYPRWAPDLNFTYGAPLFSYVYPLPNYVASFFHLFSFSFINAFKYQMALACFFGAVFMYLFTKEYWGKWGAVVSSVVYTFAPYHFVDIYIRGSVGEVWAIALFPAFLWSVTKFAKDRRYIDNFLSICFLCLIVFSHNILAVMFGYFSVSYCLFLWFQQKRDRSFIKWFGMVYLFVGALTAIFWLPALLEQKYVIGLQLYKIDDYFPELYQLLIPSWGSGLANGISGDEISLQIGLVNLFVVFVTVIAFFRRNYRKEERNSKLFFAVWFFVLFFFLLPMSKTLWHSIPYMNYFQFPWRLLSLIILVCAFLAGSFFKGAKNPIVALFVCLMTVLITFSYAKPAYYHMRSDSYYTNRPNFIYGTNSPGNAFQTNWLHPPKEKPNQKILLDRAQGKLVSQSGDSQHQSYVVHMQKPGLVVFNTAYFPGWQILLDSKRVKTSYNKIGTTQVHVPAGKHTLDLELHMTVIQKIATCISVFAGMLLLVLLLFKRKEVL